MFDWSIISILFKGNSPGLRKIVGNPGRRGEIQLVKSLPRVIENWIHDEVELPQMPADDRPYFRRVHAGIPMSGIVTELKIDAVEERSIGSMRPRRIVPAP